MPNRKNLPWLTKDIIQLIRKRNNLFKKAKDTNDPIDLQLFKATRNKVLSKLRSSKQRFFSSLDPKCPKDFWKSIKALSTSSDNCSIPSLIDSATNNEVKDNRDKAELLNHTFVSHFNTAQLPINHTDIPPVNPEDSCDCILCSEEEVYKLLCSLDTTKSNGDDDISAIMLKYTALSITEAVTKMFNISISLGKLPDEWKLSRITPIPKHGDRTNPSNYRPISLLSILSKLLEKHMAQLLTEHMAVNSPISPHQWGFCEGKSTAGALAMAVDQWHRHLEERNDICTVLFDYRKAFDTVPHRNLLSKLESLGINSYVLRWLTHYLCQRFQYVCINGSNSNKLLVTSGVPQGSVLGPILFIIYINDITHPTLSDGSMTLFADDIMIYRPICTPEDLAMLQSDIDSLTSWTGQNFLQFNADKCKYMVISRKRETNLSLESQPPLQINGVTMERVENYKYLGVWITSNLSWSKHITEVCRKARQKVGILYRKCYKNANNATMLKLYLSCIRPELEYAATVWSPHQKGQIDTLESVQKLALRVCFRNWDTNYHTLLSMNNIPSLSKRRLFLRLSFLFNIVKGVYSLPHNAPIEIREYHHYSQSHSLTLKVPYAKTNAFYYSFFCDTLRHWIHFHVILLTPLMPNTSRVN